MKHLLLVIALLMPAAPACSMMKSLGEPVVAAANEAAEPLTLVAIIWLAAEFINPLVAAFTGGAITMFWDISDEKEKVLQLQETQDQTFSRLLDGAKPELKAQILEEERQARLDAIKKSESNSFDTLLYFVIGLAAAFLAWTFLVSKGRDKKHDAREAKLIERLETTYNLAASAAVNTEGCSSSETP